MYNLHDFINPLKFMILIIYSLLSITLLWSYDDNIFSEISIYKDTQSDEYEKSFTK